MNEQERLIKLYDLHYTTEFYKERLGSVLELLISSIYDDGGIPLEIGEKGGPVYTSTSATCLLALHHMNILSRDLRAKIHLKILELKDKVNESRQIIKKKVLADESAWCITEEASVWSTSFALWALLSTDYNGDRLKEVKQGFLWLIHQQKNDNGWAFQNINSCPSRVYLTAMVLRVLEIGKKVGILSEDEEGLIDGAILKGIDFIIRQVQQSKKHVFWGMSSEDKTPDPTNTAFAIWALHNKDKDRYKNLIENGINFLRQDLGEKKVWDSKCIINETKTKYGLHKMVTSFTPAIAIILLQLGINPFDEIILKPIFFLRETRTAKGWGFVPGRELTFTTALALWTIHLWHKYAIGTTIREKTTVIGKLQIFNMFLVKLQRYVRRIFAFCKKHLNLLAAIFSILGIGLIDIFTSKLLLKLWIIIKSIFERI